MQKKHNNLQICVADKNVVIERISEKLTLWSVHFLCKDKLLSNK